MDNFKKGAVITDISGLKKRVTVEIGKILRKDLAFVGGHPLAGREGSGFNRATPEIFKGANYLLSPVEPQYEESFALVRKMAEGIGCRRVIHIEPDEHDRIIALTSHLPHVVAASLVNSINFENIGTMIGGSFRDSTRVASLNVDLWSELLMENKENVLTQIGIFEDNIRNIKNALQNDDHDGLRKIMEKADEARQKF